jgi:ubiquinone/menaquinone biosynthesis C-methylase UbiE
LAFAELTPDQHVLEVGCGAGTTTMRIAREIGCQVIATDIDPEMVARAGDRVHEENLDHLVTVAQADVQHLSYPDEVFDVVLIEAVVMFTDRIQSVREVKRVVRPGGRVVDHEFIWRRPPTEAARRVFTGEVCPGIAFESVEDWVALYEEAGFHTIGHTTGQFTMMTPRGILRDEGIVNGLRVLGATLTNPAALKKMGWLMRRMLPLMPSLGYVVLAAEKPSAPDRPMPLA